MKKIFVYALLLSFFVVLSPRFFWHEHEHNHSAEQLDSKFCHSDNEFHSDDCFACDFSLSLFTVHKEYSFFKHNLAVVPQAFASESCVERILIPYFSRRGPPALI